MLLLRYQHRTSRRRNPMPDTVPAPDVPIIAHHWPPGLTRVPFWLYQDPDVLAAEQKKLFEGPFWNFLALEVDIPEFGASPPPFAGQMPSWWCVANKDKS